jgi:hypothetical protein
MDTTAQVLSLLAHDVAALKKVGSEFTSRYQGDLSVLHRLASLYKSTQVVDENALRGFIRSRPGVLELDMLEGVIYETDTDRLRLVERFAASSLLLAYQSVSKQTDAPHRAPSLTALVMSSQALGPEWQVAALQFMCWVAVQSSPCRSLGVDLTICASLLCRLTETLSTRARSSIIEERTAYDNGTDCAYDPPDLRYSASVYDAWSEQLEDCSRRCDHTSKTFDELRMTI